MPRFVILEHDHPYLHWDFMLEAGEVLRTWRLPEAPKAECVIRAEALGDHRKAYLDYEGPVSGDRGTVKRWDSGTYEGTIAEQRVAVELEGGHCRGRLVLERDASGQWRFTLRASGASKC